MDIPYFHIDAFTSQVFAGNPAGVCLLPSWPRDDLLQKIAAENNLPETAFVVAGSEDFALRWFSPHTEIDLCGHATLAAAFVLYETTDRLRGPLCFQTPSGRLIVEKKGDLLLMDFPSRPAAAVSPPKDLISGLGAEPREVFKSRDYLAVFDDENQIQNLEPDFILLAQLDCLGIIATAPGRDCDFVSRFFAPRVGIPEDPVTGSSHSTLVPYWSAATGKQKLQARQLSRRGGELFCENRGERVLLGGRAVFYHSTTLSL